LFLIFKKDIWRIVMIIVIREGATQQEVQEVIQAIEENHCRADVSEGSRQAIIGVIGDTSQLEPDQFMVYPAVERAMRASAPYKLVSRQFRPEATEIPVGDSSIGGNKLAVIAGPCTVESEEQIVQTARRVKAAGATALRGGAFKPRTSPYSFRGHGEDGLKMLQAARQETGLPIVTEVMTVAGTELVARYADVLQIGARNMQNFQLLEAVGQIHKPVLLKRGLSASLEEFLLCAEYILKESNKQVILCERGIRTFETYTRNTLSLTIVPELKRLTHLPVIVDPSHGTGAARLVSPAAKGAVAMGADGLIIEVHIDPQHARVDGAQSLDTEQFERLMKDLGRVAEAVDRTV
jgi:3-deoxy-7-phosphoheptulonate synthase